VEALSRRKTVFPQAWKLRQEEKQYFHECGSSVKKKNSTSTSVEALSRRKTVLPQAWKLCQEKKAVLPQAWKP
jgi:hypothetical protein